MSNRVPYGTIKKDKVSQTFEFASIGHRMTLYVNIYQNIPTSHAYFYENLAASYQSLANEAMTKAKRLREQEKLVAEPEPEPVATEELPR